MQAKSCIEKMALARQNWSDGRLKGTVHRVAAVHCTIQTDNIASVRLCSNGKITTNNIISTNNGINLIWLIIIVYYNNNDNNNHAYINIFVSFYLCVVLKFYLKL